MRRLSLGLGSVVAILLAVTTAMASQEKAQKPRAGKPAAAVPTAASPLNLNTATKAQLQTLPGVGARTAELIIEHREKNGGFKKIEELMNIKGIGEKSFLKLKPLISVAPPKTEKAGAAR
jgi:competence protein ComEA